MLVALAIEISSQWVVLVAGTLVVGVAIAGYLSMGASAASIVPVKKSSGKKRPEFLTKERQEVKLKEKVGRS